MHTGLFAGLVGKKCCGNSLQKLIEANFMPDRLPVSVPVQARFADSYDHPYHQARGALVFQKLIKYPI